MTIVFFAILVLFRSLALLGAQAHELHSEEPSVDNNSYDENNLLKELMNGICGWRENLDKEKLPVFTRKLKKFLRQGNSIDRRDEFQDTLIEYAAESAIPELVKLLHNLGADIHARGPRGDLLKITFSKRNYFFGSERAEIIAYLLDAGMDYDEKPIFDLPFLHESCLSDQFIECSKVFLQAGVDLDAKDILGQTASDIARCHNNREALALIHQEKAVRAATDVQKNLIENIYTIIGNEKNISVLIADYAKSFRTIRLEKLLAPKKS